MIRLVRSVSGEFGTFGQLVDGPFPLCQTCEPVKPIIPEGVFNVIPHSGTKFRNVWEITEVPGHSAVLFHWGNTIDDTDGCVLVGYGFDLFPNGLWGVSESKDTIAMLRTTIPKSFQLEVKNAF